jgi:mannose-6-phosphate isomerase-like protein (cupin superfamily)
VRSAWIITLVCTAGAVRAQQPVEKGFSSAADVQAMVEKAKNERNPDQPNFIQQILQAAPYNVNLEYRVQGIDTNPNIHDVEAEIVYVVDGAGVLTIGGKLKDERRTNDKNRTGSKLEGGTPRRIAKGDYVLIPENTAHSFTQVEGRLVIMSVHVPRGGPAN